jgi:hypothetical protein
MLIKYTVFHFPLFDAQYNKLSHTVSYLFHLRAVFLFLRADPRGWPC